MELCELWDGGRVFQKCYLLFPVILLLKKLETLSRVNLHCLRGEITCFHIRPKYFDPQKMLPH